MSLDTILALHRLQQIQQAQGVDGKRLVLRRVHSWNLIDLVLLIVGLLLSYKTYTLSMVAVLIYAITKRILTKTYMVENIATGEKFRVLKTEFKQYQKQQKSIKKEVQSIL